MRHQTFTWFVWAKDMVIIDMVNNKTFDIETVTHLIISPFFVTEEDEKRHTIRWESFETNDTV